jgi:hypothetical protein
MSIGIGLNLLKPWPFKYIVDGVLSVDTTSGSAEAKAFILKWFGSTNATGGWSEKQLQYAGPRRIIKGISRIPAENLVVLSRLVFGFKTRGLATELFVIWLAASPRSFSIPDRADSCRMQTGSDHLGFELLPTNLPTNVPVFVGRIPADVGEPVKTALSVTNRIYLPFRTPANICEQQLAEGVGFEPTLRFPVNTLSKRAPSATRPPLRIMA